ncbi:GNAT family N-acetyltransferase [Rhodococcus sp. IEGM 1379]|uniref:GNAT family N-acetyltransferase n=1 Tax=Rhodococcus sp. IEGM 1379 TaxID=3047086 RepID=UPI0024B65228|nr:GNAT family N-acetyltransferase [Rhodococcus sp. IEGM 1379]MDI9916296.1 GNAT family N-acetyltransferase [Rhodococcus sp. IEGM 1379]
MTDKVVHNVEESRFDVYSDNELAGFAEYSESNGVRDFHHTVTYPEFRGRGLAAVVVREALHQTQADQKKIVPSCSYVEKFVAQNPEFQALLQD